MTHNLPIYELYAIRCATRGGMRRDHFIDGDPLERPMLMDYYVWAAVSPEHTVIIDTGISLATANRRSRTFLRAPADGLRAIGVIPEEVRDVVLTHLHNDHTGHLHSFPAARFHLQEAEVGFATGKYMQYPRLSRAFEVDDIVEVVRLVYGGRITFHDGDVPLFPGISLHKTGGHSDGLQFVRVHTARGWVVVASDVTHFYENMEKRRPFPHVFNVGDMLAGFERLYALAPSPDHIVPGHDPLVMERYPPPRDDLRGIVVRLDVPPRPASDPP